MILLRSGDRFDPCDPDPDLIRIEDIAWALAHLCRFNGHTMQFYSVAEHSLRVSHMVPWRAALWGLLHDGSEAYLGDVVKPLKDLGFMSEFRQVDRLLQEAIYQKFIGDIHPPRSVRRADDLACQQEGTALMTGWTPAYKGTPSVRLRCYTPALAAEKFYERFLILTK